MPDPSTVAGLRVWLRADSLGLADAAAVTSWTDLSGLGNHAAQATGTKQPTYHTNRINGHAAITFDGGDALAVTNANALAMTNAASGITMFAVAASAVSDNVTRGIISIANGSGASAVRAGLAMRNNPSKIAQAGRRLDADAAVIVPGATTIVAAQWVMWTGIQDWANADAFVYRNEALDGSNLTFQTAGTTSATNALNFWIGSRPDGTAEFWSGDMAELCVYDTALSAANRQIVWDYLQGEYLPGAPEPPRRVLQAVARSAYI